ncbi:MAG: enoyl-CoA hydratase/isomerase family protein [Qipengyuania sp.]|nr:enoyl-CoA hydratase/isomerase family protein [Qipengyuania sp.]
MADTHTTLDRNGAILTFAFDRPDKYNAFTRPMLAALRDAFETFANDGDLRVLLIRATGRYFSSGMDVTALGAGPADEGPSGFRRRYRESAWHRLYDEFEAIEKPIVVAHQGPCLGAALEMSLSCDFRLASDTAHYALPELNMGMIPGSGGTSRLVRMIGGHWARYMIMANRPIGAEQARTVGLVHEVYPAAEFDRQVGEFCLSLAAQPPEALAAAKLAIELAADLDRTQARNVERLANSSLFGREEQARVFAALRARFSKSD